MFWLITYSCVTRTFQYINLLKDAWSNVFCERIPWGTHHNEVVDQYDYEDELLNDTFGRIVYYTYTCEGPFPSISRKMDGFNFELCKKIFYIHYRYMMLTSIRWITRLRFWLNHSIYHKLLLCCWWAFNRHNLDKVFYIFHKRNTLISVWMQKWLVKEELLQNCFWHTLQQNQSCPVWIQNCWSKTFMREFFVTYITCNKFFIRMNNNMVGQSMFYRDAFYIHHM